MNVNEFLTLATTAPSADNSQPWRFAKTPDGLSCQYQHRGKGRDPFGALGHGTLISAGALHENIAQITATAARTNGITKLSGPNCEWAILVPSSAIESADANGQFSAILNRHTNRQPFNALSEKEIPRLNENSACRVTMLAERHEISVLTDSLQRCAEGRFNDPELHEWLFSSIRWSEHEAESGTGLDISTLHLPPGGRWLMRWISSWERMRLLNRFGFYRILAHVDSALFRQAPAIIAFSGGGSVDAIWEAGRTIQRTWIALNQAGIAVHPYYAITDLGNRLRDARIQPEWVRPVTKAQDQMRELLHLQADEQLHMLFRIGRPGKPVVRSRRLPASAFLQQED
jgi:hypothetical protein